MTPDESPTRVGQTSGLPVLGVSDSGVIPSTPEPGLQRRPEPSGRRPNPQAQASRLVSGLHARGALPHLKREGASYFVTFRLAGTLPREVLLQLKREREAILQQAIAQNRPLTWQEQKQLFDWYAERVDAYLDAGHGECWLKEPAVAALVAWALRFFEGQRYALHAWVVMPNHVHAVVHPTPFHTLSSILKSWKGYTALQANRLLNRTGTTFWQNESYDHCCRDDEDRVRCCAYTTTNPVTARLRTRPQDWPWSSAHVGQASGLLVPGVSDSVAPLPFTAPQPPGLRRRPELSGRRPNPQEPQNTTP